MRCQRNGHIEDRSFLPMEIIIITVNQKVSLFGIRAMRKSFIRVIRYMSVIFMEELLNRCS